MNQNVVTYTVVVSVDNRDGLLRPYMTANLIFVVAEEVRCAAGPQRRPPLAAGRRADRAGAPRGLCPSAGQEAIARRRRRREPRLVWVPGKDGHVRYIEVRTGLSDSVNTEVLATAAEGAARAHADHHRRRPDGLAERGVQPVRGLAVREEEGRVTTGRSSSRHADIAERGRPDHDKLYSIVRTALRALRRNVMRGADDAGDRDRRVRGHRHDRDRPGFAARPCRRRSPAWGRITSWSCRVPPPAAA